MFYLQAKTVLERHFRVDDRAFTFEELVEITRTSPRRQVPMVKDGLEFTQLGEFELSKLTNNILFEENVFLLLL